MVFAIDELRGSRNWGFGSCKQKLICWNHPIPNHTNQPMPPTLHSCATCNKTYKRKIFHDRHAPMCKILHLSPAELERAADAYEPLPSQREMFSVIQILATRCDTMEQKLTAMGNSMNRNRRKFDVGKWMCGTGVPSQSLWEWIASLTVSDTDFDTYANINWTMQ